MITHAHGQDRLTINLELKETRAGSQDQLEEWARTIQNVIRVKPDLKIVPNGSISREEKQLVDARSS
ncbi:MAG: hypothetical protein BAA01_13930 [Bacillus thermozeamaize]|uniref:AMP-dependent ligase C-terminal domain-containing protein n=1 Tax=Bacillus thermozeamaize TaxID=230954 RepID=A0A1Y3PL74_9BACI|nr:MAG: hypothetical protein BAA01_13930 [Bacillus thermozeamaize]